MLPVSAGRHLPGLRGAQGFSWEDVPAAARCHRGLSQRTTFPMVCASPVNTPKSCPYSRGVQQQGVSATLSIGPPRAARPRPAPSAWAERQSFANQSQISSDSIRGFSKAGSAQNHAEQWQAGPHFPRASSFPSPSLSLTPSTSAQSRGSAGPLTDDFFTSFPPNSPRPDAPINS